MTFMVWRARDHDAHAVEADGAKQAASLFAMRECCGTFGGKLIVLVANGQGPSIARYTVNINVTVEECS